MYTTSPKPLPTSFNQDMKVEAILRSGIRRFTDEVRTTPGLRLQPATQLARLQVLLAMLQAQPPLELRLSFCPARPPGSPALPSPPFHSQVGRLWTSLADYFIRRGMFERARDVYEEGLTSVVTVRDFSLVYDALTQVGKGGGWGGGRGRWWLGGAAREDIFCKLAGYVHPWTCTSTSPSLLLAATAHIPLHLHPPPSHQFEESLISAKMEQAADEDEEAPALEDDDGEDFLLKDGGDDLDLR